MQVALSDIIDVMKTQPPDSSSFLNVGTGELFTVMDEEFEAARSGKPLDSFPDWERGPISIARQILESRENFALLPGSGRKTELKIMDRFRESQKGPVVSEVLADALKSDDPLRQFKKVIIEFDLGQDWFDFRDFEYGKMAQAWCENYKIHYQQEQE